MPKGRPFDTLSAWLYLLPALLLLGLFVLWPVTYLVGLSFTDGSLRDPLFVGTANFERLLGSESFLQVLVNTLVFTAGSAIPSVVLALLVAVVLSRSVPLQGLLRSAYFLPTIISLVAAGVAFRWLFHPQGWVNALVAWLGASPVSWLSSPTWAMPVLIFVATWKQIGFNVVIFLAGLGAVPKNRYEAAELDGANGWQQLWFITVPGIRPTLVFATITTVIFTFRSFEPVYVMTGGGPLGTTNILVYYVWEQAFGLFNFGLSAAAATLLLVGVLLVTAIQLWAASGED
ncbi:carbohydrate ABC transporter permease [Gloeobacter violaceus]|uniref:Gll4275 protein n=1 Tax=Gloeobacter violaceus (strain ATCC 29082 / PCC 7421) TaxID=251221 RepID=Q7NDG0_GLOVI|nr:sugar ABC transporter permease [Gloeobacter violaceus]BAC92216.1 gll4275 [Gloeobacter violaceus PCC 7421]